MKAHWSITILMLQSLSSWNILMQKKTVQEEKSGKQSWNKSKFDFLVFFFYMNTAWFFIGLHFFTARKMLSYMLRILFSDIESSAVALKQSWDFIYIICNGFAWYDSLCSFSRAFSHYVILLLAFAFHMYIKYKNI